MKHLFFWQFGAFGTGVVLMVAGGCAMQHGASVIDPLAARSDHPQRWDGVLAHSLDRPYDDVQAMRDRYDTAVDAQDRRRLRDAVVFATLALIEEQHARGSIRLAALRSGNDAAADIAVIGLSTAATLSSGEALKGALAATASAITGANLAINEHMLREQATSAILAQMDADHAALRNAIIRQLRESDDAAYPLAAADLDLLRCLYAGSPVAAIASLAESAALRRAAARASPSSPSTPSGSP